MNVKVNGRKHWETCEAVQLPQERRGVWLLISKGLDAEG